MQDKNKVAYLSEYDLKAHINSGNLTSCYFIFGDEHYLIKNYVSKIVSKSVGDFEEFNVNRFDGAVKAQEVFDAVQSFPMMSDKRVVTLCDYPFDKVSAAEQDKLLETISDIPETTVLVLFYETVEINPKKTGEKFSKLIKAVKSAGGSVFEINRKSESEIIKLLQSGANRRKCRMDLTAARYMVQTCSDDLGTLINELEKLCLFVGEEGIITTEIIDKICSRSVEASVYNVSKAVLRGDLHGALRLLDDLFYMNTDPVYVLTLLSSAYTDIYRVFAAQSKGLRTDAVAKEFGYGNTAFRLQEAERNMRKLSEQQILRSLQVLAECDRLAKSSRIGSRAALEKCVVELAMIQSGKLK